MARAKTERYKSTIATRNLASFEFYMSFDDMNIEEEIDRNGLAYFWTFGVTKEALGDGFDITIKTDNKVDIIPDNDFFQTKLDEAGFLREFMQAVGIARAYGKCGIMHFDNGEIKAFRPVDMELEYSQEQRRFVGGTLREWVDYEEKTYHEHKLTAENIDYFYLMIFEEKSRTNRGRSVLEPIWDYLQGLFICFFLSPLAVAQSTGIKVLRSPQFDVLASAEEKEASLKPLRTISHKLALGIGAQDELQVMYPTNNTFISQTADELFTALSASTGYPKEAWRGNQQGNMSGAVQTMSKMMVIHRTIQKSVYYYLKKSINILAETWQIVLPLDYSIKYRFGEDLTEEGQAALLYKKAQAITTLKEVLTRNEIRELLGYNPDDEDFLSNQKLPNEFPSRMPMDNSTAPAQDPKLND